MLILDCFTIYKLHSLARSVQSAWDLKVWTASLFVDMDPHWLILASQVLPLLWKWAELRFGLGRAKLGGGKLVGPF